MDNTMPASVLNLASDFVWLMSRRVVSSGNFFFLGYPIYIYIRSLPGRYPPEVMFFLGSSHTVDGRNPAPLNMYETYETL